MKRRIFAFLLSMVMLCSVAFPAFTASAEEIDTVPGTVEETPEPSVEEPVVTPEPPVEPEVTPEPPVEPEVTPEPPVEPEVTPEPPVEEPEETPEPPVEEPVEECNCSPVPNADGTVTHQVGCPMYEENTNDPAPAGPQCTCGAEADENGVISHAEDCPLFVNTSGWTEQELHAPNMKITGQFPAGAYVDAVPLTYENTEFVRNTMLADKEISEDALVQAYDITIRDAQGNEIQPQGEVRVTYFSEEFADAENVQVYHLKDTDAADITALREKAETPMVMAFFSDLLTSDEEEAKEVVVETMATETTETYTTFMTGSFSAYVIVITPDSGEPVTINTDQWYPATAGVSNNGHFIAVGVYYDETGLAHALIASNQTNKFNECVIDHVTVNGKPVTGSEIVLKTKYKSLTIDGVEYKPFAGKGFDGILDITLPGVILSEKFSLGVYWTTDEGWPFNIVMPSVELKLEYAVDKTVAYVNDQLVNAKEATVTQGDKVVYKVYAYLTEDSDDTLINAVISDVLPSNLFVDSTIRVGTSLDNLTSVAYAPTLTLGTIAQMTRDTPATFYIEAVVKASAQVGDYVNTATLTGDNAKLPGSSTAIVKINTPPASGLLVTNAVIDPLGLAPDVSFPYQFFSTDATPDTSVHGIVIKDENGNLVPDAPTTISHNGTFYLKDGWTATIDTLAVDGKFEVKQTESYVFKCDDDDQFVTIALGDNTLPFVNRYEVADLTVTKTVDSNRGDKTPDESFSFSLNLGNVYPGQQFTIVTTNAPVEGEESTPVESTITVADDGNVITGFALKNGQTFTVKNLPVGATYAVSETTANMKRGFTFKEVKLNGTVVTGEGSATVGGTISQTPGQAVIFVNEFRLYDLVITKTVEGQLEPNQSFVFHVEGDNGVNLDLVIHGAGNATVKDLLAGSYTVSEKSDWSWRYLSSGGDTVTFGTDGEDRKTVDFTNTYSNDYWLNGCDVETNIFG